MKIAIITNENENNCIDSHKLFPDCSQVFELSLMSLFECCPDLSHCNLYCSVLMIHRKSNTSSLLSSPIHTHLYTLHYTHSPIHTLLYTLHYTHCTIHTHIYTLTYTHSPIHTHIYKLTTKHTFFVPNV